MQCKARPSDRCGDESGPTAPAAGPGLPARVVRRDGDASIAVRVDCIQAVNEVKSSSRNDMVFPMLRLWEHCATMQSICIDESRDCQKKCCDKASFPNDASHARWPPIAPPRRCAPALETQVARSRRSSRQGLGGCACGGTPIQPPRECDGSCTRRGARARRGNRDLGQPNILCKACQSKPAPGSCLRPGAMCSWPAMASIG